MINRFKLIKTIKLGWSIPDICSIFELTEEQLKAALRRMGEPVQREVFNRPRKSV